MLGHTTYTLPDGIATDFKALGHDTGTCRLDLQRLRRFADSNPNGPYAIQRESGETFSIFDLNPYTRRMIDASSTISIFHYAKKKAA